MSKGADADRLPPLTDVHALFNLAIAPPLALTSRPNAGTVIPIRRQESSGSTGGDKSALGKIRGVLKRMTSDSAQLQIGSPVNFRHVVHVDHGKVEVYDRSAADPSMLPPPQPVTLSRKNGSFGMNLKTVDGRTIVTVVSEGGAAQETGLIKVGNEITAIDGESIVNLEHEEVIARLKTRASVLLLVSDTRDATVAKPPVNSSVCRVCSKPASFNCSACGTLILYCSSECQRNDWPTHSTECVSTTGAAKQAANSTGKTTAGPCHVCSETGRFQCACRSVLYCSQKCQGVDFPAHKVHCSFVTGVPSTAGAASAASQPAGGRPPLPPSGARPTKPLPYASSTGQLKASDNCFYVAADRFVFKMAFRLGAFESMWSSELLPADTPAKHASMVHSHGKLFISLGAFIFCLETERGEVRWRKELGYPFDQEVRALCAIPESATSNAPGALVVGASGHLLLLEASNGHELQRKLVSTAFAPVGLYAYKSTLVAASEGMAFGVGVEHGLSTLQLSWRTRLDNANVVEGLAASVSASRPANAPPANVAVLAGAVTLLRLGKGDVVAEGAAVETPSPALLCGNEHGLVSFENGTVRGTLL